MKFAALLIGFMLAAAPALADEIWAGLGPEVPKASGEPHPEGNAYMRRQHMKLMRHDRNLTVHDGNREIGASLKQCFECHSVKDESGGYLTYESEKHFCRACHDFVAVKVDCFMCHRSTPDGFEEPPLQALVPDPETDMRLARTYLEQTLAAQPDSGREK